MSATSTATSLLSKIVDAILSRVLPEHDQVKLDVDDIAKKISDVIAERLQLEVGKLGILLALHDLSDAMEKLPEILNAREPGLVERVLGGIIEIIPPGSPMPPPEPGFTRFEGASLSDEARALADFARTIPDPRGGKLDGKTCVYCGGPTPNVRCPISSGSEQAIPCESDPLEI